MSEQLHRYAVAIGDTHPVAEIIFHGGELLVAAIASTSFNPVMCRRFAYRGRHIECCPEIRH